jgi:hypothetical protein
MYFRTNRKKTIVGIDARQAVAIKLPQSVEYCCMNIWLAYSIIAPEASFAQNFGKHIKDSKIMQEIVASGDSVACSVLLAGILGIKMLRPKFAEDELHTEGTRLTWECAIL